MKNPATETVLVYVRPWSGVQFKMLAERAFPAAKRVYLSEFAGLGDIGLDERLYREMRRGGPDLLEPAERDDIILRCRLLRALEPAEAHRMVEAMARSIEQVFEQTSPRYVLAFMIDSYVLDLLDRLGRRRGIEYVGLCASMLNGHFRVTARGELNAADVKGRPAVAALRDQLLAPDYMPVYAATSRHAINSRADSAKRAVERPLKSMLRYVYAQIARRRSGDPLNYHWYGTVITARDMIHVPRFGGWSSGWADELRTTGSRKIYAPLQWHPEATVDYWSPHPGPIDYLAYMTQAVRIAARNATVFVKEHPAFYGYRPPSFYRDLRAIPNVVIVPPEVRSLDLIRDCGEVLVVTGTAGFEAALRGKRVITLGAPYYASGRFFEDASDLGALEELCAIERSGVPAVTEAEQEAMLEPIVAASFPGRVRPDRSFNPDLQEHQTEMEVTGDSLRLYIEARRAQELGAA